MMKRPAEFVNPPRNPLPADGAAELLEALLGPDPSLAPLRDLLAEKTGRNPLFIEESVRNKGLEHLQGAEFLHEARLFPGLEYSFKHALTHEVTYGGLLRDRRRALRGQIVDAIETLDRGRLGEHTERLAHHASRGEMGQKAVHDLRQAGRKAAAGPRFRTP